MELRASAYSPTPTCTEEHNRGAHRHDAGLWTCRPPRLRPRRLAPRNTSPRRRTEGLAPQRLRPRRHTPITSPGCRSFASAPSPAGARRREPRKSSGCRRRRASRLRPRRLAPKKTSPRVPAPLAHADGRRGTPRLDAGLQISRPRRQSTRKITRNFPLACRTNKGLQTLKGHFAR